MARRHEAELPEESGIVVTTSRRPSVVPTKQRRETARPGMKSVEPQIDDLWGIAAKYLTIPVLKNILREGASANPPLPRIYLQTKQADRALPKDQLLAQVLVPFPTRELAFETLKGLDKVNDKAKLSDFFLQFTDAGEVFRGDAPETRELQLAALLSPVETSRESSRGRTSQVGTETSVFNTFFKPELLESLRAAIAVEGSLQTVDPAREQQITNLLNLLSKVDELGIQDNVNYFREELNNR